MPHETKSFFWGEGGFVIWGGLRSLNQRCYFNSMGLQISSNVTEILYIGVFLSKITHYAVRDALGS